MGFKIFGIISILIGIAKFSFELMRVFGLYHQAILLVLMIIIVCASLLICAYAGFSFSENGINPKLLIPFALGIFLSYLIGIIAAFFN